MQQLSELFYSCLLIRHSKKLGVLTLAISLLSACGAKAPNKKMSPNFYEKQIQLLLIEKQCAVNQQVSDTTKAINNTYMDYFASNPLAFNFIPARLYDYKTPLKISPDLLKTSFTQIQTMLINSPEKNGIIASELFHLYQNTNRFDSVKCSFNTLAQKKVNDYRPFMLLNEFCQQKDGAILCSDQTILSAQADEAKFLEEVALSMCQSFNKEVNCQAELQVHKKQQKMPDMVKHYQQKFRQDRFEKLFSLRDKHLAFHCAESEGLTIMTLKIYKGKWDQAELETLLEYVEKRWSKNTFKLNFEIVSEKDSADNNVIEIKKTSGFTSYVPDNNNRIVYLSDKLDFGTKQKILAHEIGHVLGFPDCYIEFFDKKEKELVYYELSSSDTNIMCTIKNGVEAPDDYLKQLREKSCLFQ